MSGSINAAKGDEQGLIYDTTVGTEKAATTSYVAADCGVIALGPNRHLTIYGHVDAGAAGSIVSFVVGFRSIKTKPLATARFYPPSKCDDLSVNAVLERTPIIGSPAATVQPAWSTNILRPFEFRTPAAIAAADEIPFRIKFDVGDAKWALVTFAQADGGAAAKVLAYYSLSTG